MRQIEEVILQSLMFILSKGLDNITLVYFINKVQGNNLLNCLMVLLLLVSKFLYRFYQNAKTKAYVYRCKLILKYLQLF